MNRPKMMSRISLRRERPAAGVGGVTNGGVSGVESLSVSVGVGDALAVVSGSLDTGVTGGVCASGVVVTDVSTGVTVGVSVGVMTVGSTDVSLVGVTSGEVAARDSLTDSVGFISSVCDVEGSMLSTLSLGCEVFSMIS